jgi:hypothetical protein
MPDATAPNTSDGEDLEEEAEDVLGEYLKTKAFGEADIEVNPFLWIRTRSLTYFRP